MQFAPDILGVCIGRHYATPDHLPRLYVKQRSYTIASD